MVNEEQRRLLVLCALRVGKQSVDWSLIAREAVRDGGLDRLWRGELVEESKAATESLPLLGEGLTSDAERADERVDAELRLAEAAGARLVTVLDAADETYPVNLRLIPNLPPFLFVLGGPIIDSDIYSVAVVGTRDATDEGRQRSAAMARKLVEHDVTVVSGLAKGIDTAALRAAIDAGGRTIGVIGTGITKAYPAENKALQAEVAGHGAVVSQFWPSTGPATWTFPRRNVVMSGISQGTVVIEASQTSGAKMQARLALEHGKRVFLVSSLVSAEKWADGYARTRGAIVVERVEDVIGQLAQPERVRDVALSRQLHLDLV